MKGTREALSTANPNTPTIVRPGEVTPDYTAERNDAAAVDAQMQAQQRAQQAQQAQQRQVAPAAPTAPVAPDQTAAYNARIAQLESGANPNIGYHDRSKGTAFGTYGLTDAAYADARRADPSLPADKTQATPAQQTAAMNGYTGTNARQLQQFGIEPNPANLATAHLLGATGLKRFQETGYLSPQAIANNGGEANLRKIIAQRQAGTGGAASGAAPAAAPAASTFQGQTNEFGGMEEMPTSQPVSPYALGTGQGNQGIRMPAAQPAPTAQPAGTTASAIDRYQSIQSNPNELMKFAFSEDSTTPDYLKQRAKDQVIENYNQQKNLAAAEKQIPNLTAKQAADAIQGRGKSGVGDWMQYLLLKHVGLNDLANEKAEQLGIGHKWTQSTITDANGNDIAVEIQTTASGKLLGGNRLDGTPLTAEERNLAGGAVGGGKFKPEIGGAYVKKDANGNVIARGVRTTQVVGNRTVTKVESGGKTFDINSGWEPEGITTAAQKAENAAAVKLRYAGPTSYTEAGAKAAGDFNFQNGTNIGYATQAPGAPLVDLNTGKPVQVGSGGVISVTQTGTPGVAPAGGQSPADITMGKKVTQDEQIKFIESKKAIGESSTGGLEIGNARRQQLELIKQNPSILNIMNGSGDQYDKARNLIVRMASGACSDENREALYKDIQALKFGPGEEGALTDFANLNTGINAKTLKANSGAGAISNAEQQANKDANIGNVDRITAYAAMSGLHRSQFAGDLAASKQMFLDKRPDLKTDAQFNSAWQKEEANLLKGYQGIAKARFDVMGKPPAAGASKEAMAAYKDRVFRAFEAYPAPQFDSVSGTWNYQTANAKRAAMKQILGQ